MSAAQQIKLMVTPVILQPSGGAMVASVTCDHCAQTDEWRVTRMPPPDILKKHFIVRGWELRKKPKCPACVVKEKEGKKVNKPIQIDTTVNAVPSDAAKRARRMVYMALEDYYDETKKCYRTGYSDKKIADETGASEAVVASIREQDFGPIGPPSEILEVLAGLAELRARLDRLATANGWVL